MPRVFFALWPDAGVRGRVRQVAESLRLQNARLLQATNLHLTLAFLGQVDETLYAALSEAAADIEIAPFSLSLDTLGWWKKPKIAWLAPAEYPAALGQLAAHLHEVAGAQGLSMEERPYRPHLTLARKVSTAPPLHEPVPIIWNIREFCLVESSSQASGVKYEVKLRWPLKIM